MQSVAMKFSRWLLIAAALLFSGLSLAAQEVKWSTNVKHVEGNLYEVVFKAAVPQGYYMYDLGPYAEDAYINVTSFEFASSDKVVPEGTPYHITEPKRVFDDVFGIEIGKLYNSAEFGQKVRLYGKEAPLDVVATSSICNEESCMPPAEAELGITVKAPNNKVVVKSAEAAASDAGTITTDEGVIPDQSLWSLIIEAIIWGLAALVTPCVFPMIPMTVSFFLKGSENKARAKFRAGAFGIFIVILYTVPIAALIGITWIFGGDSVTADIFNWIGTHPIPNILFFIIFLVFACSFFGAFEITMPSKLVNKSDQNADRGGLGGVFFMALTLVLVSFSCTGPLIGNVIIRSTSGGQVLTPILTMLAFSITFAIPFTLFAFFPSILNKLPKSGGWLNSVKVVLAFVEVALGLKFLMIADQSARWGLLDREIYLAIWIACFALLGLYLIGKLKFKHDSEIKYISTGRILLSICVFAFVIYLIPGMWGAPLKGLGGYLPKAETQDFIVLSKNDNQVKALLEGGVQYSGAPQGHIDSNVVQPGTGKYSDKLHVAAGLRGFFTMEEGMAYAKSVGKPIMVDFTGHACANCIKMEDNVLVDPEVYRILRDEYVIVALFGDDKTVLPEEDWVYNSKGRARKQLGQINSDFAASKYGASAQPTYILTDTDGNMLVPHVGYTPVIREFIDYLNSGLAAFEAKR